MTVRPTAGWREVDGHWRLGVRVGSESPIRLAVLVSLAASRWFWWAHHAPASEQPEALFEFTSGGDQPSPDVTLLTVGRKETHGRQRALLREDPRPHVSLSLPAQALTGEVIPVCEVPLLGYAYALLALDDQDCVSGNDGGWRPREALASGLPPELGDIMDDDPAA